MRETRRTPWLAVLCLLGLLFPIAASAQTGEQSTIHIHAVEAPEPVTTTAGATGLSLGMTFTLLGPDEQVLRGVDIESASLELGQDSYPAVVQSLATPWSVVIVVDGSKTMANFKASATYKAARNALANALEQAPQGASFAVISFDDRAPTVQEFTQDTEKVANALKRLQAKNSGNSCLNDGVYEAVNKLSGAPGRRAVIVFTASADNCATRSVQDVISLAMQNQVQIYAVGLKGYTITEDELNALADPTGGLAALKEEAVLGFAFGNAMSILGNQWQAKATLYPMAGPQTAQLKITLADTTVLTSPPIPFESTQDYLRPTEIHLKGKVLSTGDSLTFNLDIVSPEKIKQLNVSVLSQDTGQPVMTQSLTEFAETNKVPASNLESGAEYTLVVTAVDDKGQTLSEDAAEFQYQPLQGSLAIAAVETPTVEKPQFVITVTAQNLEGAVKYKLWLVDEQNNAPVPGTEKTIPVGEALVIPVGDLETGSYAVVVQALDSADKVLAEAASAKTSYQRPSTYETFIRWLNQSPLAIAGLTGVCCLAVLGLIGLVWLVMPKRAARPKTVDLVLPEKSRRPPPAIEESGVFTAPPPRPISERAAPPRAEPEARPSPPMARISLHSPANLQFSAGIRKFPFTVGRREGNDAVLPVDNSSGVSGQHLTITFADGHFYVQDNNSTFGTTVNGQAIPRGQPCRLEDGAVIGLGPKVKIQFRLLK